MNLLPRAVRLALLLALAALGLTAPAGAQLPRNPMAQGSPPSYRCTSGIYFGQPCERFLSNPEHIAHELPNPYPWFVDYAYGAAAGFNTKNVPDSQRTTPFIRRYIGTVPQSEFVPRSYTEQSIRDYVNRVGRDHQLYGQTLPPEAAPDTLAAFSIHGLEHQRCGGRYTGGGRRANAAYRRWVEGIARGIGDAKAIVFVEPDGIPAAAQCLSGRALHARLATIRYAVTKFAALPNVGVYIDAGTSDWRPASEMAALLKQAGVYLVRGFSVNITHYDFTWHQLRYGDQIVRLLARGHRARKHFVVNTAYNGVGPLYKTGLKTEGEVWCDPPGRALGPLPTLETGDPLADAFFWIGGPGISDNDCGKGHLPAGTFDPKWATQLINTALRAAAKGKADYPEYHGIHPENSR